MHQTRFVLFGLAALGLGGSALLYAPTQPPAQPTTQLPVQPSIQAPVQPPFQQTGNAEDASIRAALKEYSTAYKQNDVEKILSFWADDAEFIDDEGTVTKGKDAIGKSFRETAATRKLEDFHATVTSLRFLHGGLAMVDGVSTMTVPDGTPETGGFQSLWSKIDGQWRILSVRDLPPDESAGESGVRLQPLDRLIGEWVHQAGDTEITLNCRRANKRGFLLVDQSVKVKGAETLSNTIVIGFDPQRNQLRSWIFDSAGGFGDGLWQRHGNEFSVNSTGVRSDGRAASSINSWRFVDDNTLEWSATDREIDGSPLPDAVARYTRKSGRK